MSLLTIASDLPVDSIETQFLLPRSFSAVGALSPWGISQKLYDKFVKHHLLDIFIIILNLFILR
jgi:hypothetical protein